jgi:hypothetical protein
MMGDKKMKKLLLTLGGLALALAAGGAQAMPLSELLNGGSITAGDKVFDDWRMIYENNSDITAPAFDASNIDVSPLNDGGMDPGPGLAFSVSNGALDVTGDGLFAFIDYMFGFRVTAAPGNLIKDNSLNITNAVVTNSGDNGMFIQEFIGTAPGLVDDPGNISLPDLAVNSVDFDWLDPTFGGPGLTSDISNDVTFDATNQIYVSKNILVWASDVTETASLTGFEQRFSQVAIPEPSTVLLMIAGMAGLGLSRRKLRA